VKRFLSNDAVVPYEMKEEIFRNPEGWNWRSIQVSEKIEGRCRVGMMRVGSTVSSVDLPYNVRCFPLFYSGSPIIHP
jgi:hypothetical protein